MDRDYTDTACSSVGRADKLWQIASEKQHRQLNAVSVS